MGAAMAALPTLTDDDKSLIFCMAYQINDDMCPRKFSSPHRLSDSPPPVGDMIDAFLVLGAMRHVSERPAPGKLERLQVVYRSLFEKLAEIWGKVSEVATARAHDRITDIISSVYPFRVIAASALWCIGYEILSPTRRPPISIRSDGIPGVRVGKHLGVWFDAAKCSISCWMDDEPLTKMILSARSDDVVSLMISISKKASELVDVLVGHRKIRAGFGTHRRPCREIAGQRPRARQNGEGHDSGQGA
jgi:hypothetical protein